MKNQFPRSYYIPKGATKVQAKDCDAVVYLYVARCGRVAAVGFTGKADKPAFRYVFNNEADRTKYIARFFASRKEILDYKAKQQAERKAKPVGLEVGDVLRSMWGYDQTNVDYYEVTRVIGRMVEIRELVKESVETQHMQGECVPLPGHYKGEPMRKLARDGAVKIESYAWARKVEPHMVAGVKVYKPSHWTSYA